mgnify:CR=1 FL=1
MVIQAQRVLTGRLPGDTREPAQRCIVDFDAHQRKALTRSKGSKTEVRRLCRCGKQVDVLADEAFSVLDDGAGELRYGGAATTRSSAGKLEAGDGAFALHLDANSRQFNDLRIPGYARSAKVRDADEPGSKHRLENSDGRQDGGAIGGAYHWDHGYAGLSYSRYDSNYGSVAEPGVRLAMEQDHYGFASELRDLDGPFSSLKFDAGYTDYKHQELEGGEVHTTFKNKGYEARVEARHQPLGPVEGVIGAQVTRNEFSALGEEAFVPQTDTDSLALFVLEQWKATDRLDLSLGARLEHTRVDPDSQGSERFRLARSIVLSTGGTPRIPSAFSHLRDDARVFHHAQYLERMASQACTRHEPMRIAVVGGGQSAAEAFIDLNDSFPSVQADIIKAMVSVDAIKGSLMALSIYKYGAKAAP